MVSLQMQDPIYQIFLQEALALLEQIEVSLQEFLYDNRLPKIEDLVRAAHTIKGGAGLLNLSEIQTVAHRLENVYSSLRQEHLRTDSELAQLLVQAQEYLQSIILTQFQIGQYDEANSTLVEVESVFAQLEAKLDCNLNAEANLLTTQSNVDITELILDQEVAQILESLEKVLVHAKTDEVAEEIKLQAEVLLDFGEMLQIPQFVAIAQTTLDTLKETPQAALSIGQVALAGFRATQEAILKSYSTSETLKEQTQEEDSQVAALDAHIFTPVLNPHTKPIIDDEVVPSLEQMSDYLLSYQVPTSTAQLDPIDFAPEPLRAASELVVKTAKLFIWQANSIVFTLPYNSIEENLIPKASEIIQSGRQWFLHWREQMIPIYQLSELLNYNFPKLATSSSQTLAAGSCPEPKAALMLVIRQNQQILALESTIEHLVTKPELVIKPFGFALASPSYCYGCTILEDERLVQVIDVAALLKQILGIGENSSFPQPFLDSLDTALVDKAVPRKTKSSISTDKAFVILIVDDSNTWRQSLALTLHKAGYQIVQAQDGQEGIKQLQQNSLIQLVISDIDMPNMNGLEFLIYCRQKLLLQVPVVMLSTYPDKQYRQICMRLGANAYFTKPYKESELLAALTTLIEQNRRKSS